jgi:hypothetical protein
MEHGKCLIGAAELQVLREFLHMTGTNPGQQLTGHTQPVRLSIPPGQTIAILVTSPLQKHPPSKRDREDSGRK